MCKNNLCKIWVQEKYFRIWEDGKVLRAPGFISWCPNSWMSISIWQILMSTYLLRIKVRWELIQTPKWALFVFLEWIYLSKAMFSFGSKMMIFLILYFLHCSIKYSCPSSPGKACLFWNITPTGREGYLISL